MARSFFLVCTERRHFSRWEQHATTVLNERQILMLNRLLDGFDGKLTSSKWAELTKCSQDTAYRDILQLIDGNILRKNEAGGRGSAYELIET